MARADLLIRLVQSGIRGDKASFKKVVEAIIAEDYEGAATLLREEFETICEVKHPELKLVGEFHTATCHLLDTDLDVETPEEGVAVPQD